MEFELFEFETENIKGHNSEAIQAIWLVIELNRFIMSTNIIIKFHDNPIKLFEKMSGHFFFDAACTQVCPLGPAFKRKYKYSSRYGKD